MGVLVERTPSVQSLEPAIQSAMAAPTTEASDLDKVVERSRAAAASATTDKTIKWMRVGFGVLIGAGLILLGVVLAIYADNQAIDQAQRSADIVGYVAPDTMIGAVATTIITLGSAWSAGLVTLLLGENSGK